MCPRVGIVRPAPPFIKGMSQTGTASAGGRCSASKLKYQGGAVGPGPGPGGGVPGKAVPRPGGVPKGPGGAVQASGPGGVVPQAQEVEYRPKDQEEQFKNQVEKDQAKYQELKYYWQILGGAEVLLADNRRSWSTIDKYCLKTDALR